MRKLTCLIALTIVCLALQVGESPHLLKFEVATFLLAALLYGFSAFTPSPPWWLRHQGIRGVACIYLGAGALFVPAQFVVSAFFIGVGIRLVMTSDRSTLSTLSPAGPAIERGKGEIVIRDKAGIVIR